MIIDYSIDCTNCEECVVLFSIFLSFDLRNYIFQSAKKCEMTPFYLNEAAKCVDIIPLTLLASLSRLRTVVRNTKWRRYLAYLTKIDQPLYENSRNKNFERTHDWCSAVGKVAF